jgi:hypothetical protein
LTQPSPRLESRGPRGANQAVRVANAAEPDRSLVAKAVKRLVGDGRYRPEPFPRVK